jgi:hypothetical protein
MDEEIVNKSGEQWLIFSTVPTKEGLRVRVKAHSAVEDFIRSYSQVKPVDVALIDKRWISADGKPVMVYNMDKPIAPSTTYSLEGVGKSLGWGYNGDSNWLVNLGFLRLAGISEGAGIEFVVKDVFSVDFRRQLRAAVGKAFRQFVHDHLKAVKITLIVSGQEL